MSISHKTLLNRSSNRILNLKTKFSDLQNIIDETIEANMETAMDNLFKNDFNFETNVQKAEQSPYQIRRFQQCNWLRHCWQP